MMFAVTYGVALIMLDLSAYAGNRDLTIWNELGRDCLPGHMGFEVTGVSDKRLEARIAVGPHLLAPNGFLHAATVIALADTACGFATVGHLPAGATGFTTLELKSNFVGTVRNGAIACVATPFHSGRTTQVWDAEVHNEQTGRAVATFRCTQLILYPTKESTS